MLVVVVLPQGRWRDLALLALSGFFYFWGEPAFLPIVVVSATVDHLLCRSIAGAGSARLARIYLATGVLLNLGLLVYFKYANFFIDSINVMLAAIGVEVLGTLQVALPIGLSFIVFEKITYLVDVYRKDGQPARSLASYLLYVLLFPKLLAGPIVKYHEIEAQLVARRILLDDFLYGLRRFLLGLAKKVLLADAVGEIANAAFSLPPAQLGFTEAWLGTIAFTLQIYLDFSAYSDMAIGLAAMLGFRLRENFNMPYVATSFTEFWQRWHISLTSWIREYLYFPLGGNRAGRVRTYFNLWVCFLLSGLWHGANWTFVIWGMFHGLFMMLDKLFWLDFSKRLPHAANLALTLLLVMIGWVLFRSTTLAQAGSFLGAMVNPFGAGPGLYITNDLWLAVLIGTAMSLAPATRWYGRALAAWRNFTPTTTIENWALAVAAMLSIAKVITVTFDPFLYFRF